MDAVVAGAGRAAPAGRGGKALDDPDRRQTSAKHRKIRNRAMNNRLKELRSARSWTQEDIAEKLEITRQTVIALEKGRSLPSLPLAFRIADLFDKRVEEVFDPLGDGLSAAGWSTRSGPKRRQTHLNGAGRQS